ncbi:response regulator, partial [Tistlia consotensis]
ANGDLSRKITVDVQGEILELKETINTMVDQLSSFAAEVTRVAREVGTEGKLGGQARVGGVAGTWKDLTDNVNMMATNLTNQVRNIADVVTAVANGNLQRKLTVDAKGEIAQLAETINGMIDTLATFADQVTDVAREVGIEGKLGGQAKVPGAAGLWRDLTDNVNQLAANLTTQVRAIAEVATAVAKGDLTRTIAVEALGEVAALKDNINQMISNLRDTTQYNDEQDWLKTNLARFTRMMQGERDLVTVCNLVLSEVAPLVEAHHGVFFVVQEEAEEALLELTASYAFNERKRLTNAVRFRDGLVGQCAFERQRILLTSVPGDYVTISSGLGEAPPLNIVVLPVLFEGEVRAVIELASFHRFSPIHLSFLDQLVESIGIVLNTISASMRTEGLLKQSQILTRELQSQQDELKSTNDRLEQQATSLRQSEELLKSQQDELRRKNEELEEKAALLEVEKRQVEAINREVETARSALEEKAEQLALTSKYKSEFLANMSHELRTPLNSLLILSKLLAENAVGNLDERQIEQAQTIHTAGADLLRLINDILDLSKIESGTVALDVGEMGFEQCLQQAERTFREVAQQKGLDFTIALDESLPPAMLTDAMRLQQIVNNLLSNAFKFTERGAVTMTVAPASEGWSAASASLAAADRVVAFAISDTGIGIPDEQQQIIFEAFQQADGTTSRRFGGTGLGLSISRELAALLGGEIRLQSEAGKGSTFTLYLPLEIQQATQAAPAELAARGGKALGRPAAEAVARTGRGAAAKPEAAGRRRPFLLIVEDDKIFAGILLEIAQEQGFEGLVLSEGRNVMPAIRRRRPDAVSLDIQLPDIDGWALLDLLRHDAETRHLPVHIVSIVEDQARLRTHLGPVEYSAKPASREHLSEVYGRLHDSVLRSRSRLLLASGGKAASSIAGDLAALDKVETEAASLRRALGLLAEQSFDCLLVVARKPTEAVLAFLKQLSETGDGAARMPVVVELLAEPDPAAVRAVEEAGALCVSGRAAVLDEVTRMLHVRMADLGEEARSEIRRLRQQDPVLGGRKVAVVDDDIRNIFSLASVLEQHRVTVVHAENGRDGIALLEENPDIEAMLVDIMMPGMDGYETIAGIRRSDRHRDLPLIAVTAKAMPEDRAKCFEAGASDYLSKPVEIDELIAVLRTWLQRRPRAGQGER